MILRVSRTWSGTLIFFVGCAFNPPPAISDAPVDPDGPPIGMEDDPSRRVTAGLIGLWAFDEGAGNLINDTSTLVPVSPTINNIAMVTWAAGELTIDATVEINTGFTTRNRLIETCQGNDAVTLEAWVTPDNITQTGTTGGAPARIVSMGPVNAGNHEISLGQIGPAWVAHVRTANVGVDKDGNPALQHPIAGSVSHLVVTASSAGRSFYVNGELVTSDTLGGTLDLWDKFHGLVLAGDPNGKNTWLGTLHLIAMYGRVLDDVDVKRNFNATHTGQ
jgi:hypothetical protein